jgi:hypothetical protein
MYDNRLLSGFERWFTRQKSTPYNLRKCVFELSDEQRRDSPYDFQMSSIGTMQMNRTYAERHGYDFIFRTSLPQFDDSHPPYWAKIKMVRDALNARRDGQYQYECVLWLDTDACVPPNNHHRPLRSLFGPETAATQLPTDVTTTTTAASDQRTNAKHDEPAGGTALALNSKSASDKTSECMSVSDSGSTQLVGLADPPTSDSEPCLVFSPDQPDWQAYFCAGVFAVRNCSTARALFDEWLSRYDPSAWKYSPETGKWECSGEWGGIKYEQGVGCELVQNPRYRSHVRRMPWYFFNNHNYRRPDRGFSMHFAGIYKLYIEPFIRYVVPTLTCLH